MHLKANTASLKYNWSLTGNQFNDFSIGVTWSYLPFLTTIRAAKYLYYLYLYLFLSRNKKSEHLSVSLWIFIVLAYPLLMTRRALRSPTLESDRKLVFDSFFFLLFFFSIVVDQLKCDILLVLRLLPQNQTDNLSACQTFSNQRNFRSETKLNREPCSRL